MKEKTVYESNVVDYDTGEVKTRTWLRAKNLDVDTFVRAYVQDVSKLAKCSRAEQSVILCGLKYIDYDTNELYLNAARRLEICDCANLTKNTVNMAISALYRKNILIKDADTKKIVLNPKLYFFGTDISRAKALELTLRYELNVESNNKKYGI